MKELVEIPKCNKAFENDLHIKQVKLSTQESFIKLAELLKENRDKEYYKELDYDTFEAYIASPELSFKRSTVYSLISIYEKYVLEFGVQPVGLLEADYSKLDRRYTGNLLLNTTKLIANTRLKAQ